MVKDVIVEALKLSICYRGILMGFPEAAHFLLCEMKIVVPTARNARRMAYV
jgi:hypothetical protein